MRFIVFGVSILCLLLCFGCGKSEPEAEQAPKKRPAQEVQKATMAKLTLPADIDALKACLNWTIVSAQVDYLAFDTSDIKKDVQVNIPLGTRFAPSVATGASYIAIANNQFLYKASPESVKPEGINVFALSLKNWGASTDKITFKTQQPEPESKLYQYLQKLSKVKKYDWMEAQIGAWVVNDNIQVKQLFKLRIQQSDGFLGMNKTVAQVYSYATVKATEKLLQEMGYNVSDYQVFAQNQQRFDDALAVYKLKDWDQRLKIGFVGNLFNSLAGYEDEIAVKQLIMEYLKNHSYAFYREQALEKLLDMGGVDGANGDLISIALMSPNRMVRIAAALTLWQRSDPRAVPILLVYQYDEPIMAQVNFKLKALLEKKTGKKINDTDNMLQLWEQNNGWQELAKKVKDIESLKEGVKKLIEEEKDYMTSELSLLATDNSKKFNEALAELARRFPYSRQVYDYIKNLSVTLKNNEFRLAALKTATGFKAFNHFDYLKDRVKNDHYLPMKQAAIYYNGLTPEQQIELLGIALKCSDSKIRNTAAALIKRNRLNSPKLAKMLAGIARRTHNMDARVNAMQALVIIDPKRAFDLIKYNTTLKQKKYTKLIEKSLEAGSNMIKAEKMFDLLRKVAKTYPSAKIRRYALERLYLIPSKKSLRDIFVDRIKNDKKESVRLVAIQEAARLAKRKEYSDKGFEKVIKLGLKDSSNKVKREAVDCVDQNNISELLSTLTKTAIKDDNDKIKSAAFLKVHKFDKEKGLSILKKWLKSNYVGDKKLAVENLINYYADNPETKKLLSPYKKSDNKQLRQKVKKYFK